MEQAIEICNYHPNYGEHAYAQNFLGEEIPMNQIERLIQQNSYIHPQYYHP